MHLFYDFIDFVLLHTIYMCVSRNASHTASQGWARGLKKPQCCNKNTDSPAA